MDKLEQLVLKYESFACIQGPLACAAVAVGVLLLLAQLACCPLLLLGRWGVRRALLVLFATDEELERALLNEGEDDEEEEEEEGDGQEMDGPEEGNAEDGEQKSPPSSEGLLPQPDPSRQRHGSSK